jgi:hypothetical protein
MVEVESTVPIEELENDLHDDQEDLNSQTVIQNRLLLQFIFLCYLN